MDAIGGLCSFQSRRQNQRSIYSIDFTATSADGTHGSVMCLRRDNPDLVKISVLIVLKLNKEKNV